MKLWHALLIVILVGGFWWVDRTYLGWDVATFLGKQLARLTEWMAFWR